MSPRPEVVGVLGLLAQTVRAVGDHDRGDARALDALRVPEVGAGRQRRLLLQGELGQDAFDVEDLRHRGVPPRWGSSSATIAHYLPRGKSLGDPGQGSSAVPSRNEPVTPPPSTTARHSPTRSPPDHERSVGDHVTVRTPASISLASSTHARATRASADCWPGHTASAANSELGHHLRLVRLGAGDHPHGVHRPVVGHRQHAVARDQLLRAGVPRRPARPWAADGWPSR